MAKKLNSADYLLLGGLVIGGAGYYLYTKGKLPFIDKLINKIKGKEEKPDEPTPTDVTPVADKKIVFTPPKNPLTDANYLSKVRKIQLYINTGVDGDAGTKDSSDTNQALKKKFPTLYATYGRLTPSNVDKYVEAITKQEASAIALQKDTNSKKSRIAFGQKLINLYYKDKVKIVRTNDTNTPIKYLDKARNIYVNDGGNEKIYKNESLFPKYQFLAYDINGYWILITKSGKFIVQNPNEYVAK